MLQTYAAQVTGKQEIAPKVFQFTFKLLKPKSIDFKAGQYFLLDVNGAFRHYSFSSSPSQKNIVETVVDISPMGIGSKYLLGLKINDQVSFRAPLGQFFLQPTNKPKIFLATGTGMVPFKSMILNLVESDFSQPFNLFWGLRQKTDLYFNNVWEKLAQKNQNFKYTYCLSREKIDQPYFFSGHIQDCFAHNLSSTFYPLSSNPEYYLCGRPQTVEDLKQFVLNKIKIPKNNLFFEKFT